MNSTNKLDAKINKYLALAGGVSVVATGANAQIMYTDVNPDYLLSGNMSLYSLDLNNDTYTDFLLMSIDTVINSVSTSSSNVISYNVNAKAATINPAASSNGWIGSGSYSYPSPLAQGATIGSSAIFNSSGSSFGNPIAGIIHQSVLYNGIQVYNISSAIGEFQLDQEGILGLRFKINTNIHYGWARVEFTSSGTLSIKDYAYDATPNTAISAGETGSGLVSVKENVNTVQVSNFNNNIKVELSNDLSNAQLKITNMSGQEILSKELNTNIEIISMDEYATGIYLAIIVSDQETTTKRVYIR